MSNYTQSTNFATKDALPSGDPLKIVKGTEINTEFNNIATAVSTKADLTSPTLVTPILGTPTSGILTNCTGLPVSTGVSGLATGMATFLATPSSANLAAALTDETGTGANVFATSPTLVTPLLGTPTSGTMTNVTGLPLNTGVTGTLPVGNGGTGVTTSTGTGNVVLSTSPTLVTPALGTPTSGVMTNVTGLPLITGVTGTLPVANGGTGTTVTTFANLTTNVIGTLPIANGGTGATNLTTNNVLLGNGTSALQTIAPSTNGNVLTSNGSTWISAAPGINSAVTSAVAGNGVAVSSATGAVTFSVAAPTFNTVGSYAAGSSGSGLVAFVVGTLYSAAATGIPGASGTWRCVGVWGSIIYGCSINYTSTGLFVRTV